MDEDRVGGRNWRNWILSITSLLVVLIVGEMVLRWRYAEPLREPSAEVKAIQPYLIAHPVLGFTWRPNVAASENIVFHVNDVEFEPLSTDKDGFINPPEAIERRTAGDRIDVVGVGDSFIEHAASPFYEAFKEREFFYYNMAVHRYSTPQYREIVANYALALEPRWIVYGIFENDFAETEDVFDWQESGLDWFTFHSGTWCGPSLGVTLPERLIERHLRGYEGLYRVIQLRLRGDQMSITGPSETSIRRIGGIARESGMQALLGRAQFVVVLIPSRATVVEGASPEFQAYERLVSFFQGSGVGFVDLRWPFMAQLEPGTLYYEKDGHWNEKGMAIAAKFVADYIEEHDGEGIFANRKNETK